MSDAQTHTYTLRIRIGLMWMLIVLTLAFIFSNSCAGKTASAEQSGWVWSFFRSLLGGFFGGGVITHSTIRKMAHFIEFFALGAECSLLCVWLRKPLLSAAFAGLVCALTDETIQIFSERGSQVTDVWLDFAGVCTAIVVVWLYHHRRAGKV